MLLLLGRYAEGWREYEWRWRMERFNGACCAFPSRAGTAAGWNTGRCWCTASRLRRHVPVRALRRAGGAALRPRGGRVPARARGPVAGVEGVVAGRAQGEPLPAFDAHMPLIAFPGLFGTDAGNHPWRGPYIHADPRRLQEWQALGCRRRSAPRARWGWSGPATRPMRPTATARSHCSSWLPLAQAANVSFFSLQKGGQPVQPATSRPGCTSWT
jgi:hypothetical protein